MSVSGANLVGGDEALETKMQTWGYLSGAATLEDAVALYQATYGVELNAHAQQIHGRNANFDGEIGPATARVINGRTCNVPDFANAEEARWPDSCKDEITFSWNFQNFPGATEAETTEAWNSLSTYTETFDMQLVNRKADFPNTRIWARLKALPGGTLAWSFLANNSCSHRCEQAYDSTVSWSSRVLRVGTVRHEGGHALGMNHTPGDPNSVMYPSMRGQWELNSTDIRNMIGLGYKRRTSPPPDPEPPDENEVLFSYTAKKAGEKIALVRGATNGGDGWEI